MKPEAPVMRVVGMVNRDGDGRFCMLERRVIFEDLSK